MESPKPYLRAIQREVSVVLRAAEDPAILTFKQVSGNKNKSKRDIART